LNKGSFGVLDRKEQIPYNKKEVHNNVFQMIDYVDNF